MQDFGRKCLSIIIAIVIFVFVQTIIGGLFGIIIGGLLAYGWIRLSFGWMIIHPGTNAVYLFPKESYALRIYNQMMQHGAMSVYICGEYSEMMPGKIIFPIYESGRAEAVDAFEMDIMNMYKQDAQCRDIAARLLKRLQSRGAYRMTEAANNSGMGMNYILIEPAN